MMAYRDSFLAYFINGPITMYQKLTLPMRITILQNLDCS